MSPGEGSLPLGDAALAHTGRAAPPLARFVLGRTLRLAVVLIALWTLTFLMVRLVPGDPAARIAGQRATGQEIENLRERLGLNESVWTQFTDQTGGLLLRGDLGQSFQTSDTVASTISERLPESARLAVTALAIVIIAGTLIGLIAGIATERGRRPAVDAGFSAGTSVVGAVPDYVVGTLLVYVFAVQLGWFPVAGASGRSSVVLPALAIAIPPTALLARIVRAETVRILAEDFVMTARSKGLPARLVYLRHVLPNVLTAALTIGGLIFAGLVGGTVVIENLFAWPGLGTELVQAVTARDYPVIQGTILFLGVVVVIVNAVVDVALGILDPRSTVRA
jgi:peptide/nickel transport system permease protein